YCKAAVAAGEDDDLAAAQKLLRAALKIRQDDAQALSMLTLLWHSQNNKAAAKELLAATVAEFPTNPWALGLRGMILRDQGNTKAALADFDRAQVDSPDLAWIALEHAQCVAATEAWKARKLRLPNFSARMMRACCRRVFSSRCKSPFPAFTTSAARP